MTSIDQKDFAQTPIDYRSTDLDHTIQQKDHKGKKAPECRVLPKA